MISNNAMKIFICSLRDSASRSIIEIASFLGIMPSTYLRKNILEKLVEAGYLFASKKGRAVYYKTITSKVELKRF